MTERPINFSLFFFVVGKKEGQIFLGHEKTMNEWRYFVLCPLYVNVFLPPHFKVYIYGIYLYRE